jgi:DNA-binding MarR family transcriptional regulator
MYQMGGYIWALTTVGSTPIRVRSLLVQWDALRHLDQNPDASLHDLVQLTFQTDQSFGTLAGRMIDRGMIERLPGPGRAVRHRLTDKGRRLRHAGDEIVGTALAASFGALTPAQLATFDRLLVRLLASPEAATAARHTEEWARQLPWRNGAPSLAVSEIASESTRQSAQP